MRISRLEIPAFGPFTEFAYNFDDGIDCTGEKDSESPEKRTRPTNDFHIFLGNNESGKSSLLRAISNLLYGIHQKTPENFLHDYNELRLNAELVDRRGDSLYIQRKKASGDKKLTDIDGKPVSQDRLDAFMGNISKTNFHALFGLGAEELQQGNEMLLSTNGALSETIAAASSGSMHVAESIRKLKDRSLELHKPRGNSLLRSLKNEIKEYESKLSEAITRPAEWDELIRKFHALEATRKEKRQELASGTRSLNEVRRMQEGLEILCDLKRLKGEWAALALPNGLTAGLSASVNANLSKWQITTGNIRIEKNNVQSLEARLEGLVVREDVLAEASAIDQLSANLNVYKSDLAAANERRLFLKGKDAELDAALQAHNLQLDRKDLDDLRISREQMLICEEIYSTYQSAESRVSSQNEKIQELQSTLATLLPEPPVQVADATRVSDPAAATTKSSGNTIAGSALAEAIEQGIRQLEHVESLGIKTREIEIAHEQIQRALKRLGLNQGEAQIRTLAVPQVTTIRVFAQQLIDLAQESQTALTELEKSREDLAGLERDMDRSMSKRKLPTREELLEVRASRESAWKAAWENLTAASVVNTTSPDNGRDASPDIAVVRFAELQSRSDVIADLLIDNAEEVAAAEERQLKRTHLSDAVEKLSERVKKLDNSRAELNQQWRALWSDIKADPETPEAMLEWRTEWLKASELLDRQEADEADLNNRKSAIIAAFSQLCEFPLLLEEAALADLKSSVAQDEVMAIRHLPALVNAARKMKQRDDEAQGATTQNQALRTQYEQKLEVLKTERSVQVNELLSVGESLEASFKVAGFEVALPDINTTSSGKQSRSVAGLSPASAYLLLKERAALVEQMDKNALEQQKLSALEEKLRSFSTRVSELANELGIEGEGSGPDILCHRLAARLKENRDIATERLSTAKALKSATEGLQATSTTLAEQAAALLGFCKTLNVETPEDLIPLSSKLGQSESLQGRIQTLESSLARKAGSEKLADFIAILETRNPDLLAARQQELNARMGELEIENDELVRNLTLLQQDINRIETSTGDAADIRQHLELLLARQREAMLDFIRNSLAGSMLKQTLEDYREKNEQPIVAEASSLFQSLTSGSYDRIVLSHTANEEVFIQGRHRDGRKLAVGQMSDGTRDQLYLAMRLSALKMHLDAHEPMPLIVDDLLITFDDRRTESALEVLAELSRMTQVILFTHHGRVLDSCRKLFAPEQVMVTEL